MTPERYEAERRRLLKHRQFRSQFRTARTLLASQAPQEKAAGELLVQMTLCQMYQHLREPLGLPEEAPLPAKEKVLSDLIRGWELGPL